MADTTPPASIFGATDPVALFREWLSEAEESEPNDPNAIALASADEAGMPNVRIVLLKDIDPSGFVFYTNYESAKSHELAANGRAAFVVHWKTLRRQIRVRGHISREDGEQADAYYASRALDSRLGAWASEQSTPLADRDTLMHRLEAARERFGDDPPRPDHWGGFRLAPVEMEFWSDGAFRLHDRERWTRSDLDTGWHVQRLFP